MPRLDKYLAELYPEKTRSFLGKLIEQGKVLVNGVYVSKPALSVDESDEIEVIFGEPQERPDLVPENIPLDILLETKDFLAINKAKNMSVHPADDDESKKGTVVNAVLFHCGDQLSGVGGERRPGIVHRLDKDTTGVLVIAKNDEFHAHLAGQIEARKVKKIYRALVVGCPKDGTIEAPIARSIKDRKKMAVRKGGKIAITSFRVIASFQKHNVSLVEIELITGRTHQIRVHFASIGYPVIGDATYGNEKANLPFAQKFGITSQVLHSYQYEFTDLSEKLISITAPAPDLLLEKNNPLEI
jgi:23S rRNA pseudouridine1911/1915/1917 synthase